MKEHDEPDFPVMGTAAGYETDLTPLSGETRTNDRQAAPSVKTYEKE